MLAVAGSVNGETAVFNLYYKEARGSPLLHATMARPQFLVYIIKKPCARRYLDFGCHSNETGFLLGIFSGGQNLLLCRFLLLCYCFRAKFQGGARVFRGGKLPQGAPPAP